MRTVADPVTLWWHIQRNCDHGPHPIGYERDWCRHDLMCRYGMINNPEADPREPMEHLMVIVKCYAEQLAEDGPRPSHRAPHDVMESCIIDADGNMFIHLDFRDGRHYVWKLLPAAILDKDGRKWSHESLDLMLGVWPD